MIKVNERNYYTDEGKVFIHKESKEIYGWGICLGENDSIDNYEEIDCPEDKLDDPAYNKAAADKRIRPEIEPHER